MYKPVAALPPSPADVEEAVRLLRSAKRPAILCGLGAVKARAEAEVTALAEYLGAPVAASLYAGGSARYPLYLGISGGLGRAAVDTLAESDVMLVIGASLNEWTTAFRKILDNGKTIVQVDVRPEAFGGLLAST